MLIQIKPVSGEIPRLRPHALPPGAGAVAKNCEFRNGVLGGMAEHLALAYSSVYGTIRSGFIYDGTYNGVPFQTVHYWTKNVDAVRSPVAGDAYYRFYFADGASFLLGNGTIVEPGGPANPYKVGVPAPTAAPTLTAANLGMPLATGVSVQLACERSDGSLTSVSSVTPAYASAPTKTTWTFATPYGFSCPASSGSSSSGGVTTNFNVVPVYAASIYSTDGMPVGSTSNTMTLLLYKKPAMTAESYIYFGGPVMPNRIDVAYIDNTNTSVYLMMYRLGTTGWYSDVQGTTPPNTASPGAQSTTTTTSISNVGPVAKITITLAAGGTTTAIIRQDASKSSLPNEWAGLTGVLTVSGSTYTITLSADATAMERRAYVYTYVNWMMEEGPPSPPAEIDVTTRPTITVAGVTAPSGYAPINRIRVYRTATGSGGTEYLYVGETYATSFSDAVLTESLGEPLATTNYYPPSQALRGVCIMGNGIMVGFKDNELHFSEPYLCYAWDPNAIKPLPARIVGIKPFEGGLFVTTTAQPYVVMGTTPQTMTDQVVPLPQAGVSKDAIATIGNSVVYASNDGLVFAQGVSANLEASFKFFTREVWRTLYGSRLNRMHLNAFDGGIIAWFDDGSTAPDGSTGFVLRFEEGAPTLVKITDPIYAAIPHPTSDALYISRGSALFSFCAGATRKAFEWRSGQVAVPKPTNLGAIQMIGTGSFTVELYGDTDSDDDIDPIHSFSATLNETGRGVFRLPGGHLSRRFSVRLLGSVGAELHEMTLANSVTELERV